jgi:hypothetical protein
VLDPLELLDRLAQFIVPPRRHRNITWGALAPHSALRPFVVLTAGTTSDAEGEPTDVADQDAAALTRSIGLPATDNLGASTSTADPKAAKRPVSSLWAVMLAKVYEVLPILAATVVPR